MRAPGGIEDEPMGLRIKSARRLALVARRWLRRFVRRGPQPTPDRHHRTEDGLAELHTIRFIVGCEACSQLELALRDGHLDAAEHAIARAMSVDPTLPRLTELRAWFSLRRGAATEALKVLETEPALSTRLKLLLQLVRIQAGQKALAHLELNSWARQPGCPATAKLLLAFLDADRGDHLAARRLLMQAMRNDSDAELLEMTIVLDILCDMPDAAEAHADELAERSNDDPLTRPFLETICLREHGRPQTVSTDSTERLAAELAESPEVITTLVVGQRCQPRTDRIELLCEALNRVVDDLSDPQPAVEALAELEQLRGRVTESQHWAWRGLQINPLNASLALLLHELEHEYPGEQHETERLTEALQRIAREHPDYADVQRALVRRYLAVGQADLAHRIAHGWVDRQPDHPLAQRTLRELAA
jgi:tetratricopeptide (TPR) repeat protein